MKPTVYHVPRWVNVVAVAVMAVWGVDTLFRLGLLAWSLFPEGMQLRLATWEDVAAYVLITYVPACLLLLVTFRLRVRITGEGFEYRTLFRTIRVSWKDVSRIEWRRKGFGFWVTARGRRIEVLHLVGPGGGLMDTIVEMARERSRAVDLQELK